MFSKRKGAKRFSLLLLEEEEDYVQDWVVTCRWPDGVDGNWQGLPQLSGRIRLCTRSLFFEPDDVRIPIVRLPMVGVQTLAQEAGSRDSFVVTATKLTKMRANMEEVPYVFEQGKTSTWSFSLLYAPLQGFMSMAQELLTIGRLPRPERLTLLEGLVRKREDAAVFDTSRLVDFSERLLYQGIAVQLTPLVKERGHLVVTDMRVYFQPLHNVAGDVPVRSHPLAGIAALARRRSCLRPVGLELFFITVGAVSGAQTPGGGGGSGGMDDQLASLLLSGPTWDAPSAFFAFRTEVDRERAAAVISAQPELGRATPGSTGVGVLLAAKGLLLEAAGQWLRRVTAAWQHDKISNFDYLLYLNFAAGRSFNDLAQWPVFPWVLRNYTAQRLDLADADNYRDLSKPIGALNPSRLADFRRRFRDMPADDMMEGAVPPFMYGTHYSSPGYVMYWLVRAAPSHMLRLQNGRFDAPDRLFSAISESWESVLSSSTDVKELIPEFYLPNPDFLTNTAALPLGVRQSGRSVGHVDLPPWATSPFDFIAKNRAALESPAVSRQLHLWIDLIFGCKQRGAPAEAADNVFYHLTYEGAVDIDSCTDALELKALETQINEFGQTPKQLFLQPHPPRVACPPPPDPNTVFGEAFRPSSFADAGPATSSGGGGGDAAGLRALTLALLATILAAAAPEFAEVAVSEPLQPDVAHPSGDVSPPRLPAIDGISAAERAGSHGRDAPSTTSGNVPSASAAQEVGRSGSEAAAEPPSPSADSSCSLGSQYSGLLKLGRYTQGGSPAGRQYSATLGPSSTAAPRALSGSGLLLADPIPSASGHPTPSPEPPATRVHGAYQARHEGQVVSAGVSSDASLVSDAAAATPYSAAIPSVPSTSNSGGGRGPSSVPQPAVSHEGNGSASALPPKPTDGVSVDRAGAVVGSLGRQLSGGAVAGGAAAGGARGAAEASSSSGRAGPTFGWGRCVAQSLSVASGGKAVHSRTVPLSKDPLLAVTIAKTAGGTASGTSHHGASGLVYVAGSGGLLRVLRLDDLSAIRSAQLDGDLLCLAPMPVAAATAAASASALDSVVTHLPLILLGTHTGQLLAYDLDRGRLAGRCEAAHDDALCCCCLMGSGTGGTASSPGISFDRLATSSWDCSVKIWSLAEGREPWGGRYRLPELELREFDAGVWAMDVEGGSGGSDGGGGAAAVVAGTEEGDVSCWDLRNGKSTWRVSVGRDYIGGVRLTPCGRYVVVAAADGNLSLIDRRMVARAATSSTGVPQSVSPLLARVACGAPLRCCASDGQLGIAGDEASSLHLWDVGWLTSRQPAANPGDPPGPDGLYTPWVPDAGEASGAVNGIAVGHLGGAHTADGRVCVALAGESGVLTVLRCGAAAASAPS